MPNRSSVDHAAMRGMNISLILNTLRQHAPISRAGLSARTGLNKATVSSIVRDLMDGHFVHEIGIDSTSTEVGRPAINLELNADAGYIMSVEIGVDFITVVAVNFAMRIVEHRKEQTLNQPTQDAILKRTIDLLREVYQQVSASGKPVFGLGVGVPGLVDMESGTLLFAPNLGWRDVSLYQIMTQALDLPVYVANEANMAALGESYFREAQHSDLLLFVSSGVGIGGGIVINGQLLTGATGFTGEVGHMTIDPDGLPCNCGNRGCWETLASQRAIFHRIRQAVAEGKTTCLLEMTCGSLDRMTVDCVVEAATGGDAVARDALTETGRWLGIGLANLMNVLNPQMVVFGGSLSLAHEFLLPVIKKEVADRVLPRNRPTAEIVIATHGADACVIGGAAIVHHDIVSNPTKWL